MTTLKEKIQSRKLKVYFLIRISLLLAFIKEMGVMFHEIDLMIYNTAYYG
jgi:hypothetical protein